MVDCVPSIRKKAWNGKKGVKMTESLSTMVAQGFVVGVFLETKLHFI